ncbi:MAG: phytanoyl-CoA dioxygenase [Rhodospirillaceae bacterium]|jgi:ectoine hydroxylase|nr:phytanoyl-CoA dioxygenase [Rhodospirillaceae bacterium]MBT6137787.1 phytanoyl-CoA dioxygenase [Rhodospirillaceae bacterium]
MNLTEEQKRQYHRDGLLVLPELFSEREVAILRGEIERLCSVDADCIFREGADGAAKAMFRMHEPDGPTYSAPVRAASRQARTLGIAQQLFSDNELYMHHCKINMKPAVEGTVWNWHQDFGSWHLDGVARPEMTTMMVMLDEATEMGGCLYMLPGSHKGGWIEPYRDETTVYKTWATPADKVIEMMAKSPAPVALTGKPGTAAIFDCNILHGSGHNLSGNDRWQAYFCYNRCSNRPADVENPRPDWVRSQNWQPMDLVAEGAILAADAVPA